MYHIKRVHDELWMIMMYQCRFTNYNKCTTLIQGVDRVRLYMYGGRGHGELVLSTQFCCEAKTALLKVYLK